MSKAGEIAGTMADSFFFPLLPTRGGDLGKNMLRVSAVWLGAGLLAGALVRKKSYAQRMKELRKIVKASSPVLTIDANRGDLKAEAKAEQFGIDDKLIKDAAEGHHGGDLIARTWNRFLDASMNPDNPPYQLAALTLAAIISGNLGAKAGKALVDRYEKKRAKQKTLRSVDEQDAMMAQALQGKKTTEEAPDMQAPQVMLKAAGAGEGDKSFSVMQWLKVNPNRERFKWVSSSPLVKTYFSLLLTASALAVYGGFKGGQAYYRKTHPHKDQLKAEADELQSLLASRRPTGFINMTGVPVGTEGSAAPTKERTAKMAPI